MLVREYTEVEERRVEAEGAEGVSIRVLVGPEEGAPGFVMRRFSVVPGGHTPFHSHEWEHEVYVLSGRGEAMSADGPAPLGPGTTVFVEPGERHNFVNTGGEDLEFICVVPRT